MLNDTTEGNEMKGFAIEIVNAEGAWRTVGYEATEAEAIARANRTRVHTPTSRLRINDLRPGGLGRAQEKWVAEALRNRNPELWYRNST